LQSCRRPREEPPAHLTRLRAWRSSAPPFWNLEESGLLPWFADADALAREKGEDGPVGGLGCEVVLRGYAEHPFISTPGSERADLSVVAWLGTDRGPFFLRADGRDNQNDMRLVFPLVGLRAGDPVVFEIRDRDLLSYSRIDWVDGVLEGPPPFTFTGRNKTAQISCWPLARAVFDRAMPAYEAKAKEGVVALLAQKPNPLRADLGWYGETREKARNGVLALAPFAGWDDPRVAAAVASLRSAESDVDATFRRFVSDERARLGATTTLENGLVITARRVRDGPPQVEVDVKNPSGVPIAVGYDFHPLEGFDVVGTRSELFPDEKVYELSVPPGGTVTLHYRAAVGASLEAPRAPMILRSRRREIVVAMNQAFVVPGTRTRIVASLDCPRGRSCLVRLATEGATIEDVLHDFRVEARLRGRLSGYSREPGVITLADRSVVPEDLTVSVSPNDRDAELPWLVATDR
jgi:hypothetical protein